MWEVKKSGYHKLNEIFLFESIFTSFKFSSDGKTLLLSLRDQKTIMIYDALTLKRLRKFELKAIDSKGNDVLFMFDFRLSKDGKYILYWNEDSIFVFDNFGNLINKLNNDSISYMYSNTEFAFKRYGDGKENLIAVDFLK